MQAVEKIERTKVGARNKTAQVKRKLEESLQEAKQQEKDAKALLR